MADLIIRDLKSDIEIDRIKINNLSNGHVERVMLGIMRNMNEDYYIDDSEIDEARAKQAG